MDYALNLIKYYNNYVTYDVLPHSDNYALCFIINCIQFKHKYQLELNNFSNILPAFDTATEAADFLLESLHNRTNIGRFITLSICCSIIMCEYNAGDSDLLITYLSNHCDFCEFARLMQNSKPLDSFLSSLVVCISLFVAGFCTARYFYNY